MKPVKELPGRLEDAELFEVEGKAVAVWDGFKAVAFLPEAREFPFASVLRNGAPCSRKLFDSCRADWAKEIK